MLVLVSFSRMIGVRYLMTICEKGSISLVILYSVSLRHVSYFMDGLWFVYSALDPSRN